MTTIECQQQLINRLNDIGIGEMLCPMILGNMSEEKKTLFVEGKLMLILITKPDGWHVYLKETSIHYYV